MSGVCTAVTGTGGTGGGGTGGSGGTGGTPCNDPVTLEDAFETTDRFTATAVSSTGATDTEALEPNGGNPDGYRRMQHLLPGVTDGSQITVFHLFSTPYDPVNGAIDHLTYSEDRVQFDPPFPTAAVGAGFFLVQDGIRYALPLTNGAFTSQTWERTRLDDIVADDFNAGLDFTLDGGPIQFGFYRSNSHSESTEGITITHGIDNWRVEICR